MYSCQPSDSLVLSKQVLTTLGTYFSAMVPDWPYSAMVLALGLTHSLLCMLMLAFIDPHVHAWMIDSLKPKSLRSRHQLQLQLQLQLQHQHQQHQHQHQRMPIITNEAAAALEHTLGPIKIGIYNLTSTLHQPRNDHSILHQVYYYSTVLHFLI